MNVSRAIFLSSILLLYAIPQTAAAFSVKYRLDPQSYQDIFYYYEEPVGQGDSLHGYFDPATKVTGFIVLDFINFDPVYNADGYFTPDVKQYSFTNGLRTFTHQNSYMDFDFGMKFGPKFELEKFGFHFDEYVPVGDWSTLYLANTYLASELRYLYLPDQPDACYDGEFGLCTEFLRGTSNNAVTWTIVTASTPGAIGTLASGLLLMGAMAAWRSRRLSRRG